jgi:hypothetical protein
MSSGKRPGKRETKFGALKGWKRLWNTTPMVVELPPNARNYAHASAKWQRSWTPPRAILAQLRTIGIGSRTRSGIWRASCEINKRSVSHKYSRQSPRVDNKPAQVSEARRKRLSQERTSMSQYATAGKVEVVRADRLLCRQITSSTT